jgi:hypothetical protein
MNVAFMARARPDGCGLDAAMEKIILLLLIVGTILLLAGLVPAIRRRRARQP